MSNDGITRPGPTAPTAACHRSPSLDAQLQHARGQLQDWVTCPSSKTPEGKAKIRQASEKLEEVKQQIKKADGDPAGVDGVAPGDKGGGDSRDSSPPRRLLLSAPMGGYLDVSA